MMELLRATGVRLGLVTNGEQWMLVNAPRGETTGYRLLVRRPVAGGAADPARRFPQPAGRPRFFGVPEDDTLEALLDASANDQQEVTDQLGYQVRRAVEVLVEPSIGRPGPRRALLDGITESELYEAALTVMMRLVFLFSAEERGLLLLGDPLYDQHYAVSHAARPAARDGRPAGRGGAGAPLRRLVPAAGDVPGRPRRHPARPA